MILARAVVFLTTVFLAVAISETGFCQGSDVAPSDGALVVAQAPPYRGHRVLTEKVNENTVTIVSGNPNGTLLYLAYDLSAVLDKEGDLRVLPIVGKGAYQNVVDVLHLKGVDLGITQSNIIRHLVRTGELGGGIERRLAYITVLYTSEMHVLAGKGIEKLSDLNGKKVNFSDVGSGTQFATRQIFGLLGINAREVNMGQSSAYLKVKSGELAATVITAGKPVGFLTKLKALDSDIKLLPVPYTKELESDFLPARLSHADYPQLLAANTTLETVGFGMILFTYNWPRNTERYHRVEKLVNAMFSNFQQFRKPPRHPKWRQTNLAAELPGLTRFPAAEEWLKKAKTEADAARARGIDPVLARAHAGLAIPNDPVKQEALFRRFLEWESQRQEE
ncbi:MAG: TAXI family TRAP transporter solute-binding subunit [Hyphomicrobiaceae bacterium]